MAFAAASAGAILSLPLAPPVKEDPKKKEGLELSLVREQEQLEAWTAATVGLPVDRPTEGGDADDVDLDSYYIQGRRKFQKIFPS